METLQSTRESIAVMPPTNWGLPYRRRLSSLCPVSKIRLRVRDILSVLPFYSPFRVIHGQQLCDDSTFSLGNFLCIGHGQKVIEAPGCPAHPKRLTYSFVGDNVPNVIQPLNVFHAVPRHLKSSQHLDLAGLQTCAGQELEKISHIVQSAE